MGRTTAVAVPVLFLSISLFFGRPPAFVGDEAVPEVVLNDNREPAGTSPGGRAAAGSGSAERTLL